MYSPTTRLLTVLELLQAYKSMAGSELARRLEVDKRTVRRYITTLQDMGIPVEGERGPYGAYHLERGYKLPPMMFTDGEAVALTLALIAIRELHFPVDAAAIEGALAKTERVMPAALLQQVRALQEAIRFNVFRVPVSLHLSIVVTLSSAIQQTRRVRMRYQAFSGGETERLFDPYGIVFHEGYWYTAGFCHLRGGLRTFRLDRIVELEPGEAAFERPAEFDLIGHVLGSIATMPGDHQVEVLFKASMETVRPLISPEAGTLEEVPEGVIFRREAYGMDWIVHMLLLLPVPLVVRKPEALRQAIRDVLQRGDAMLEEE